MTETTIEIQKQLRDCPHNREAKRGTKLIYDFPVHISGEHRATIRSSGSGRAEYGLYDPLGRGIALRDRQGSWDRAWIISKKIELDVFRSAITSALARGLIPSMTAINAERERRVQERDRQREMEREAERQSCIRDAAPELYAALEALVDQVERSGAIDDHGHPSSNLKALAEGRAALAKARGEP